MSNSNSLSAPADAELTINPFYNLKTEIHGHQRILFNLEITHYGLHSLNWPWLFDHDTQDNWRLLYHDQRIHWKTSTHWHNRNHWRKNHETWKSCWGRRWVDLGQRPWQKDLGHLRDIQSDTGLDELVDQVLTVHCGEFELLDSLVWLFTLSAVSHQKEKEKCSL